MSTPFIGEIRIFAGNFAPSGWALCHGQLLPIAENDTLFALIGTTYGGNGETSFGLPDMRGRIPVHQGAGPGLSPRVLGQRGGSERVTLGLAQIPAHSHTLVASSVPSRSTAGSNGLLAPATVPIYGTGTPTTAMAPQALASAGGGQPHENMAPYLAINFIIALFGIFPNEFRSEATRG